MMRQLKTNWTAVLGEGLGSMTSESPFCLNSQDSSQVRCAQVPFPSLKPRFLVIMATAVIPFPMLLTILPVLHGLVDP